MTAEPLGGPRRGPLPGHRVVPPAPARVLGPAQVHLWASYVPWTDDARPSLPTGELDARERKRAAAFVRGRDRLRYVSAHLALRRVLAVYLGTEPARVVFGRDPCPRCGGPHGRPVLPGSPPPLHFSLSHSHGRALVALAGVPVGADVQRVPSPEAAELCLAALHLRERRELTGLPPSERPAEFARVWARKEAYLKGLGTGLARGPGTDYLGGDLRARPAGWLVADVPGAPGHATAVALHTRTDHLATLWALPLESLHTDDAAELITAAVPAWRSTVRAQ
ncbi:4'-phosphopantetheinyl transferase family protein [Streptomyces deccanensis]|uniref:4'-phosphopantetheinyl transferase family protein n=1 Tax=Streptomyces deccanensis TaxID=424188 RepID=UPI001EFA3AF5|nr:4'-phosphopantetheinyl transferase superfamily protein [Streptomyces deccanensis]ULR51534.1 4'-phosphopantetheinyl transferase superfamily protein [Streptomyces deccanensis]